ncbi:MAG: response regulator, partial [Anaerolineales bacterium]|nr:response regulator [Anaerolineales bacterium]
VQAARNGREALAILREHGNEIALILTYLIMPEMGGKALLQALKQAGTTIKVIVMTGHPLTDEKETIMALGAVDWVNKPPSLEKLGLTIARALE